MEKESKMNKLNQEIEQILKNVVFQNHEEKKKTSGSIDLDIKQLEFKDGK